MECLMDPIPYVIHGCLSHFAYDDAIFLSERLHSESQIEESLYLLALCYYQAHKVLRTYQLLKTRSLLLPQSKYLLSKCCLELNRYGEAETVLTECTISKQKLFEEIIKEYGDYSCFVLQILAHVYSKTDRIPLSIELHKKCLRLNPFLWSSFEALCNYGEKIDPAKYFSSSSALNIFNTKFKKNLPSSFSQSDSIKHVNQPQEQNFYLNELFTMKENSFHDQDEPTTSSNTSIASTSSLNNLTVNNIQHNVNETQNETTFSSDGSRYFEEDHSLATPPQLISTVVNKMPFPKKCLSKRLPVKPLCGQNNNGNLANIALSNQSSQTVRRSSRIFAQSANAVKENKKHPGSTSSKHSTMNSNPLKRDDVSHKIGNKKLKVNKKIEISGSQEPLPASSSNNRINNQSRAIGVMSQTKLDKNEAECGTLSTTNYDEILLLDRNKNGFDLSNEIQKNKIESLMKILRDFGSGYLYLTQYELHKALETFELLPVSHFQSSFILSAVGKAFFELSDYHKAEKIYLKLRQLHPYHLEGLEYYSTVLWHLQKEITLSSLSQELTDYDKLAPETWCVVGNCFSLHKEHDAAIKFFQRATQINSEFVYAYNLLGHEYFLIEEMEKGLSCFRKAIFLDPRHYNAWYGISMINLKQEKFFLAEKYLKRALMINPHSSTLMCHIAVVYHSMRKSEKALEILDRALDLDPKNFLCKFHRASILFSMEKYELALLDFEKLRRQIPKESLIYYMIGKTHKKLRNIQLSLMFMSWAQDLDPKGVNNQLKESIDKRYVVDNDSTFARELESINTLSLESIYGFENDNNYWNNHETIQQIDIESNSNIIIQSNINNSASVNSSNDPCPSVYVNTLSNLLSIHHISGKADNSVSLSVTSDSIHIQNTDLLQIEQSVNVEQNLNSLSQLETASTQVEDQLMDMIEED